MKFQNSESKWRYPEIMLAWVPEAEMGDNTSDTLRCLGPFFWFSRIIGLCPLSRQGNEFVLRQKSHSSWWFTWLSLFLMIFMWINFVVKTIQTTRKTSLQLLVNTTNVLIFYTQILINSFYIIWKVKDIPAFVNFCVKVEVTSRTLRKDSRSTTGLVRDIYILFVFYTVALLFGNTLYYISIAKSFNLTTVAEFLAAYNEEIVFFSGNQFSSVVFLIGQFYCEMTWSFPDVLISILAMVLARLFSKLNNILATHCVTTVLEMENLRSAHRQISELVYICNKVFGPLFFINYVANVAYFFTRLYIGLGEDLKNGHILVQIEALYAFTFLFFTKILIPSYLGAKLNEKAHEGLDLIHSWSSTVTLSDYKYKLLIINRFVSQMTSGEIGFSGCGYFTVTKSFVVTLLSALITYEIIVLQFQATTLQKPK